MDRCTFFEDLDYFAIATHIFFVKYRNIFDCSLEFVLGFLPFYESVCANCKIYLFLGIELIINKQKMLNMHFVLVESTNF